MNTLQISQVTEETNSVALSKEQNLFKKLVKKIDEQTIYLQDLQTAITLYQFSYFDTYLPLKKTLDQYQIDFVFLLDSQYHHPIFSQLERQKLVYLITHIAKDLLLNSEAPPQLKELFNCYSDVDYDQRYQQTNHEFKSMMRGMSGIRINDFQPASEFMAEQTQLMVEPEEKWSVDEIIVSMPGADRLKECNQQLIEKLAELRIETEQQELAFQLRFGIGGGNKFAPAKLVPDLLQEVMKLRKDIEELKVNLYELADPEAIKAMLKNFRHPTLPMSSFDILDDAYF